MSDMSIFMLLIYFLSYAIGVVIGTVIGLAPILWLMERKSKAEEKSHDAFLRESIKQLCRNFEVAKLPRDGGEA